MQHRHSTEGGSIRQGERKAWPLSKGLKRLEFRTLDSTLRGTLVSLGAATQEKARAIEPYLLIARAANNFLFSLSLFFLFFSFFSIFPPLRKFMFTFSLVVPLQVLIVPLCCPSLHQHPPADHRFSVRHHKSALSEESLSTSSQVRIIDNKKGLTCRPGFVSRFSLYRPILISISLATTITSSNTH